MKKILATTLALVVGATLVQAQGLIKFYNLSSTFYVTTNTAVTQFGGGTQTGGTGGNTAGSASGQVYYYQLLLAPFGSFTSGTASSTNPISSAWFSPSGLALATNYVGPGTLAGPGGNNGTAVTGWPNGGASATSDTQGTEMDFLIVGWSASLGNNWTTVSNLVSTSFNNSPSGYFGVSQMGYGYSGGGGTPASGPVSLFGASTSMPGGLPGGFTLFATPVPEPSTFALAGLGAAALMIFRRKK